MIAVAQSKTLLSTLVMRDGNPVRKFDDLRSFTVCRLGLCDVHRSHHWRGLFQLYFWRLCNSRSACVGFSRDSGGRGFITFGCHVLFHAPFVVLKFALLGVKIGGW